MSHPSSASGRPDSDTGVSIARPPAGGGAESAACGRVAGLFRWEELERLRAAAHTILELADDGALPAPLEPELTSFKESLERAFLHLGPDR